MSTRTWETYVGRLRQTVLHSADVLPEEVAAYLREVEASHSWERSRKVLAESGPLMRHLPRELADFAIAVLTHGEHGRRRSSIFNNHELGFQGQLDFFPPAHVQGPFLGLLRSNEDHGLRLVNTLSNLAVARWQSSETAVRRVTPLPQTVELPSGPRELSGDETVYYWFRTNGMAPNAVACCLMALEAWMEEQISGGRDPEELFERVLGGSDCIATAGICVSLALQFPERCQRAAVPLVGAPGLWRMDLQRSITDGMTPMVSGTPAFEHIEKVRAERDAQPHRRWTIRDLAHYLMVNADAEVRTALERAAAQFTVRLPFRFAEEERDDAWLTELRQMMENFQSVCVGKNYHATEVNGQLAVRFEPPPEVLARSRAAAASREESNLAIGLSGWTERVLGGGTPQLEALQEAVTAAKRLQRADDFSVPPTWDEGGDNVFRLRAIAGTAAAVVVANFRWSERNGIIPWCQEVLLAAAATPYSADVSDGRYTEMPGDPRLVSALGLGALVSNGASNFDVRHALLELLADTRQRVPAAVMQGLSAAWTVDPELCWNALALGVSLSQVPERLRPLAYNVVPHGNEEAWRDELVREAKQQIAVGENPALPRVASEEDGWYLAWNLLPRILAPLPLETLAGDPLRRTALIQLLDDLMAWTLNQNLPRHTDGRLLEPHPPYSWNAEFLDWVAALARFLTPQDVAEHVLRPLRDVFDDAPGLTADVLKGYVQHHLGVVSKPAAESVTQWKEIADWVLASEAVERLASQDRMSHDIADAATLPIFVWQYGAVFSPQWPHAPMFADVIERWVDLLGTNAYAFACLLMLVDGPGWNLAPTPALGWIGRCVEHSMTRAVFLDEHDNSSRLAAILQRIWHEHRARLLNDSDLRNVYATTLDRLAAHGNALASALQRVLEEQSRGA